MSAENAARRRIAKSRDLLDAYDADNVSRALMLLIDAVDEIEKRAAPDRLGVTREVSQQVTMRQAFDALRNVEMNLGGKTIASDRIARFIEQQIARGAT